jgi:hypothetical protein
VHPGLKNGDLSVTFPKSHLVVMFGLKTIEILRPETQTPHKRKLGAWLFKENRNLVLLGLTCKSTNLGSLSRTLP